MFIIWTTLVVTLWIQFYIINKSNIDEVLHNLGLSLVFSLAVLKTIVCMSKETQDLLEYIRTTERNMLSKGDKKHLKIYNGFRSYNYFLTNFFTCMAMATCVRFYLTPFFEPKQPWSENASNANVTDVSHHHDRPLPLSGWFPIDTKKYYVLCFVIQVIQGIYSANYVASTDTFFYSLMIYCVCRCKLLQHMLKYIDEDLPEPLDQELVYERILNCVEDHKDIIK